jgi:hypothetical protein
VAMFRQLALAFLAVALTAGIIGCGSSGTASPLASDSATAIFTEATENTIAAQSFTIAGGTSASLFIDLTIVRGLGCSGTIFQGTTTSKLIWAGPIVYEHTSGMPADEWMKGASTSPAVQGLIALCNPSNLLAPLTAAGVSSATRSVTVYDGQPALAFTLPGTQKDPSQTGSIVVTDTQQPLLLDISEPGAGAFAFTGYGATKTITPPTSGRTLPGPPAP